MKPVTVIRARTRVSVQPHTLPAPSSWDELLPPKVDDSPSPTTPQQSTPVNSWDHLLPPVDDSAEAISKSQEPTNPPPVTVIKARTRVSLNQQAPNQPPPPKPTIPSPAPAKEVATDPEVPLNVAAVGRTDTITHDGLQFRSRSEIMIYDELKKRDVLFFPNTAAILGGRNIKREPDFLVCSQGKWGLLEVMGKHVHTAESAVKDHDRLRLFDDYGLSCIHFYPAERCYKEPKLVVDDFLKRLNKS